MNRLSRKLHRWGGLTAAIPLLLVIITGIILQLKKDASWIQPATKTGSSKQLSLEWPQILAATKSIPESEVQSWDDIDRLDVRPSKGLIKIRCKNHWEIQLDSATGEVLSSAYRRSDFIESLHDGSFFSDFVKLYVFTANGLILLGLWITGAWLWYLPFRSRNKKRRRLAKKKQEANELST